MNSSPETTQGRLARLADLAYRRRGRMVLAWIGLLVAVIALTPAVAGDFDADYATPGSESKAAADLVRDRFPGQSGETVDVVWRAEGGAAAGPARRAVDALLARAERLEGVGGRGEPRFSADGTIGLAPLTLDRPSWDVPVETGEELIALAGEASGPGVRVELGGGVIQQAQEGATPEVAGLLAAAFILLIAFGSVVAAGLPIATALFGLGISATLIGAVAAAMDVPDWAPAVAGLIGIGVGIDYALLVLTRFRTELGRGLDPRAAVSAAVSTAGRSVLVAGSTVMLSLLGLFLIGVSYLRGVAISASLAVLVVMAAAVTLLPALLSYAGPRVNRLRLPGLGGALRTEGASAAARWSRLVQRRAWPAAIAGTLLLLVLAAPVLGLRLGFPDAGSDGTDTTTRAAHELTKEAFGAGAGGPLLLAAELPAPGETRALRALAERIEKDPGVAAVRGPEVSPDGSAALLVAVPVSSPQDPATERLVERLRDDVLPVAEGGASVHIGGTTAGFIDQSDHLAGRLPIFIAVVVGLAFLLLLAAFRAPVVALKAGLMNLLSIGAAYGVVAAVAEGGFLGELVGIGSETPVPPFIPVMMFAILFGLSMDYEVFLLSRVREELAGDGDTSRAVADGLARTARVITAAAAIMVAVFMAFLLAPEPFLKLMGVGMATAIFVDATVVRMVLVPSVMQLMGRANWWIPRWLDRLLPSVGLERAAPSEARA